MKIAFITPTKDRPDDIRKMLRSYLAQTRRPDQVIIVDSSAEPISVVVEEFPELKIDYKRWTDKPSAAGQRNGGVELLRDDIDLVCFFDDDQVLHPDAVEKMLAFWEAESNCEKHQIYEKIFRDSADLLAAKEGKRKGSSTFALCSLSSAALPLGAASFYNTDNDQDERPSGFKSSRLSQKLGLYANRPGRMAPSGWQSLYGPMDKNTDVEWMGSGAAVIRRDVLMEFPFDEFFEGYSYLEDLDFSYSISRKYRLTVVVDAKFDHFHSSAGRGSGIDFGMIEVRNRRYIVKKHGLSMASYRLGMFIRFFMSLGSRQFVRARGNITACFE